MNLYFMLNSEAKDFRVTSELNFDYALMFILQNVRFRQILFEHKLNTVIGSSHV